MYLIDTCTLINYPDIVNVLKPCYILSQVLVELDLEKKDSYGARRSKEILYKLLDMPGSGVYSFTINGRITDDVLIEAAKKSGYKIVTDDVILKMRARDMIYEHNIEIYSGVIGEKDEQKLANCFSNPRENMLINEYIVTEQASYRYDGVNLSTVKNKTDRVKCKNQLQRCAVDLLLNDDIPVKFIIGKTGSGKTFLTVAAALEKVLDREKYGKIMVVRNPKGDGEEIGFLPGDKDQKIGEYFKLFDQYCTPQEKNTLMTNEKIIKDIPHFIKGMTYDDTFIIVEEAEDFTYKELKLIGTRVGKNSTVVFVGDYKQGIRDADHNNPLLRVINNLKQSRLVGVVSLDDDVRSNASKLFADNL